MTTKVVVGIFKEQNGDADPLEKWFSEDLDIRFNEEIVEELISFIKLHEVKSVVVTDGIIGCPHEEGIDYPEGKSCPKCPYYWAGRDRWTPRANPVVAPEICRFPYVLADRTRLVLKVPYALLQQSVCRLPPCT